MGVPFLPTLSTFLIVVSGILVAIGWKLARAKKLEAHKKTMIAATISAVLFLIIYLSRTIFFGNTAFAGPENAKIYYTVFLIFHIVLATTSAVFGAIVIRAGFKRNLKRHRKLGPLTAIIWIFTAITGIAVYLLLYIIYKGGETTSMIKAILGL